MFRTVFLKSLRDQRRGLIWWTVGLVSFAVYTISFYPTISGNAEQFGRLFDELPKELRALVGVSSDVITPEGYLSQQLFQLTVPLLFLIFTIRLGARAIAGEERAGTLDLLLSTPIARWRVVIDKFLAMAVGLALVGAAFLVAVAATLPLFDVHVSTVRLSEAMLSAVLVGLVFGTLALAVGCATGSRGVAVGVATALGVAAYSVNALSALVPALDVPARFSPFYYYGASQPIRNGLDPLHVAVLLSLIVALAVLSVAAFQRPDVAV